jgi:hypothetical protein
MFGKELRDVVPTMGTPTGVGASRRYVGIALSDEGQDDVG